MNDLRIEDNEQQAPYAGLETAPVAYEPLPELVQLRDMLLWVSKQQWPQPEDQTWDGLVAAFEKYKNPDPLPELPSRGYRVGR